MPTDAPGITKLGPYLANLRHVRHFLAVCEFGSIERASTQLGRLKSAIVRSVQELEHSLGVALFERRAGDMRCNAYGDVVRHRSERALRQFRAGLDAVSGNPGALDTSLQFPDSLFHESRLHAFVALAESGHLPGAAASLGVTPLAISRSVNNLERSLDVHLFVRLPQGMAPTLAARAFCAHVKRALFELQQIMPDIGALQEKSAMP